MKHRIPSDPLQEAKPAVGSLCPLFWAQGLFIERRTGPGPSKFQQPWQGGSPSSLQKRLRITYFAVVAWLYWC